MLDLKKMTSGDAKHTLRVYSWIGDHLKEIQAIATRTDPHEVSACQAQSRFHQTYTCLECTRFIALTITIASNQDALDEGEVIEPDVLLYQPQDRNQYAIVDHLHTTRLEEVAGRFGIPVWERTWKLINGDRDEEEAASTQRGKEEQAH